MDTNPFLGYDVQWREGREGKGFSTHKHIWKHSSFQKLLCFASFVFNRKKE